LWNLAFHSVFFWEYCTDGFVRFDVLEEGYTKELVPLRVRGGTMRIPKTTDHLSPPPPPPPPLLVSAATMSRQIPL